MENKKFTAEDKKLSEKFQIFAGKKIQKTVHRVKGKDLVEFAEIFGNTDPKYVGKKTTAEGKPDYSKIIAHPCYPNILTIGDKVGATFEIMGWRFPPKDGQEQGEKLIKNFGKLLHMSQLYDYTNSVSPIISGMILETTGYVKEIYVKNKKLWIVMIFNSCVDDGKLVVQSTVTFIVREGGF